MYDPTNCMIITLLEPFVAAFGGVRFIHVLDVPVFLTERVAAGYVPLPAPVTPPPCRVPFWAPPNSLMLTVYNTLVGHLPSDFIHERRTVTGPLRAFFSRVFRTKQASFEKGLKVIRMTRLVVKYASQKCASLPDSFDGSVFESDPCLVRALALARFHFMDLPYLIWHLTKPVQRRSAKKKKKVD